MVEKRDVSGYLPAQGASWAHGLEIEIEGELFVGDESSLVHKFPVPPKDRQIIIDPEPPPFIGMSRRV